MRLGVSITVADALLPVCASCNHLVFASNSANQHRGLIPKVCTPFAWLSSDAKAVEGCMRGNRIGGAHRLTSDPAEVRTEPVCCGRSLCAPRTRRWLSLLFAAGRTAPRMKPAKASNSILGC